MLRLRHELNVLKVLADFEFEYIPQPEKVEFLPDRGICASYPFQLARTFQQYLGEVTEMDWADRIGEILKFAKSLAITLSKAHLAGIVRMVLELKLM